MNSKKNEWHRSYHIFQNIGHEMDRNKHQDFNRLILGKYIYTNENLKFTHNFQVNLQHGINFLLDIMTNEGFIIPITFYNCCSCQNLRETVQHFQ